MEPNETSPPTPNPPKVAMDASLTFQHRQIGDSTVVVVGQPSVGKYYHMGPVEHRVATLLDGSRDVAEIVSVLHGEGIQWQPDHVAELVSTFVGNKIAMSIDASSPHQQSSQESDSPPKAPPSPPLMQRLPRLLSMTISQRIPLFSCNRLADRLVQSVGWIYSPVAMLFWLVMVASGIGVVMSHQASFYAEVSRLFDPGIWLVMLLIWVVAKTLHELGHATAARYHGAHVGKAGIMFFMMAPLAYVDVTDAWKLSSRFKRVQIALSGVYIELAIASACAWIWYFLPDGYSKHLMAQIFLVTGPATLLVNANPLLRLDGYYVLSDLTNIPNLRMHGRDHLSGMINRQLVNIPPNPPRLSGWRRPFATAHAIASVAFQVVWMGGLVIGVAMWAKGLGMFLAIAAASLWAILPATKWVAKVWQYDAESYGLVSPHRRRLGIVCFGLLVTLGYFATVPSPFARRVPVVVRYREEQIVRAASNAFVDQVFVARGERVQAGALLMQLSEPQLVLRRDDLKDDLKLARMRQVQFRRQGELAMSAAESEKSDSLQRQWAEIDAEVASLQVHANRSGLIVGSHLDSLAGRYVSEGDVLFSVCDPQEKELLAAITPADIEAYNVASGKTDAADVRLRGGNRFVAFPSRLRPRATQSLPHPAMGANVGGPIAVEPSPDGKQEMRSASPLMESVTPLDPLTSAAIQAGQIGTMTISDDRSLVKRVIESIRH